MAAAEPDKSEITPFSLDYLRLLESAIVHAADAVVITEAGPLNEPGPRIVYVNPAFSTLTGYASDEVIGRSPRFLQGARSDRATLDRIRAALGEQRPIREELVNYGKNGSPYWIELSIVPVFDQGGPCTHFIAIQRDITSRKAIEESLRVNQERAQHQEEILRLAFSAARMSSWVFDYQALSMRYSIDSLAFGPGPMPESMALEAVDPRDRDRVMAASQRAFEEGGDMRIDFRGSRLGDDDKVRWYMTHGRVQSDPQGRALSMIGVTWDITQIKETEDALNRQVRYQQAIAACSQELIRHPRNAAEFHNILTDALRHLREASQSDRIGLMQNVHDARLGHCYRIIAEDYAPDRPSAMDHQTLGQVPWEIIPKPLRDRLTAGEVVAVNVEELHDTAPDLSVAAQLAGIRTVLAFAIHVNEQWWGFVCLADGDPKRAWKDHDALLVRTATQMISAFVQRSMDRSALDESEQRFRLATEMTRSMVYDWNIDTGHVYRSDGARMVLGYNQEEMEDTADWWFARVHPDDVKLYDVARGSAVDCECRVLHKLGHYVWIWDRATIHRDASGKAVRLLGIAVDITQRKQLEQEREAMERHLQETQKLESLGVLAGGIAHDFNNLLTTILGNASLTRMRLGANSPEIRFVNEIEIACKRAGELCQQMLAYAGKGRFVLTRIDLNQLIRETSDLLGVSIGKSSTLSLDLDPTLPHLQGDATQLRQVLMNLVLNAAESLADYPGLIQVRTYTLEQSAPSVLCLEVQDNGCGMTSEVKERMFEPFFSTKFTGRGLGLAATLGIVNSHQGRIEVETEPGRGTTIRLLLPAQLDVPPLELPRPSRGPSSLAPKTCILVVDDEAPVRVMLNSLLREMGHDVVLARDGLDALAKLADPAHSFRLLLLDIIMPSYSGEQVLSNMHANGMDIPVVLMSGFSAQEMRERFPQARVAGYLQKPFDVDTLLDVLHAALT